MPRPTSYAVFCWKKKCPSWNPFCCSSTWSLIHALLHDPAPPECCDLSLHDALPIYRLRRQNVGYSNFSQPQSHLSFCVLLQYLVERRRVVTQLGKLD